MEFNTVEWIIIGLFVSVILSALFITGSEEEVNENWIGMTYEERMLANAELRALEGNREPILAMFGASFILMMGLGIREVRKEGIL